MTQAGLLSLCVALQRIEMARLTSQDSSDVPRKAVQTEVSTPNTTSTRLLKVIACNRIVVDERWPAKTTKAGHGGALLS